MRRVLGSFAGIGVLLGAMVAQATPVVYTDEASFQAAIAGVDLTVEGFNAISPGWYPSLDLGAMSVNAPYGDVVVSDDPIYVTEGTNGLLWSCIMNGEITFDFTSPTNVFAIDMKGVGTYSTDTIHAYVDGRYDFLVFVDVTGSQTDVRFFGLIDFPGRFSSVTLLAWGEEGASDVGLDRAQYGLIPEPATAPLIGLGLGLLGMQRRRRHS